MNWSKRALAKRRWARNAVRAKARRRMAAVPDAEEPTTRPGLAGRKLKPTWKIQIERWDGQRVQITAHAMFGKLLHGTRLETGKQLGRRIGVLLQEGAWETNT